MLFLNPGRTGVRLFLPNSKHSNDSKLAGERIARADARQTVFIIGGVACQSFGEVNALQYKAGLSAEESASCCLQETPE